MGDGGRPAGWSDLFHRACLVLCTAAIVIFAIAGRDAHAAPLTKQAATKQAAALKTSPLKLSPPTPAETRTVRPRRVAKVERRSRHERAGDRAPTDLGDRINKNTLVVIAGGVASTDLAVTHELSVVLDDGDDLRVLPLVGAGGGRNIRDVRFMKGVDLAITQTNLLARMRESGEIGPLHDKIVYLAKLFNEEVHLLVRADSGLGAIEQLAGRAVSLGELGSGTQLIAHDVLDRLGITVREVNMSDLNAIERLAAGEIDAVVLIGGRPIPSLAQRPPGLRLLAVPFAKGVRDDFLPASLSSEDYPGLIEPGSRVDTLAVGTVLIAYNWAKDSEHYRKIAKFVAAFFPQLAKLQGARHHPKWREVNLAASLPGWTRFPAAEAWLAQHRDEPLESERDKFERFVRARGGEPGASADRARLFREFLQWSEARARR
jgi:TRAP-type uncharacterized transport system substrate-binding protein